MDICFFFYLRSPEEKNLWQKDIDMHLQRKREHSRENCQAVLAAVSLVLFVTAVLLAFFLQGQYGYIVGGISLCAMLLSVYGFAMGLKAFQKRTGHTERA